MVNINEFLELVDVYAAKTGRSESTIARLLFNDGKRLSTLRDDPERDIGIRKVEEAVKYLSDNWPENVAWPKRIPRPVKVVS